MKQIRLILVLGCLVSFVSIVHAEDKAPAGAEKAKKAKEPTAKEQKTSLNPVVKMVTNKGEILVELNAKKAPITVANFLAYIKDGFYNDTVFHRIIKGFMVQGGGMTVDLQKKKTKPPIKNESYNKLRNKRGTIAMARTNAPDSATSQFFINHVDNRTLDFDGPYKPGYAVFGKVTKGMEVVDAIAEIATKRVGPHGNVPVEQVVIKSVTLLDPKAEKADKKADTIKSAKKEKDNQ
ncbi:MAG: peptidylprolyl isomerase [Planctomycetota bacterium]